jgi:hypothetical protein
MQINLCYLEPNNSTVATLDTSGNLGLGVTPSAWSGVLGAGVLCKLRGVSTVPSLSFTTYNSSTVASGYIASNAYYNGTNWIYHKSNYSAQYEINNNAGKHIWYTAPSGTAGTAISFTQAMTLDNSGNLIVGGTTATNAAAGRGNITLNGSSSAILSIGVGGVEKGYIYTQGTDFIVNADTGSLSLATASAQPILFQTNNTERMRHRL